MIKENQKVFSFFFIVMDWFCLALALAVSICVQFFLPAVGGAVQEPIAYLLLFLCAALVCTLCFYIIQLYGARRSKRFVRELRRIFYASGLLVILLLAFLYVGQISAFTGMFIVLFGVSFFIMDAAARFVLRMSLRMIRKKGLNLKYLLLVGNGDIAADFLKRVRKNPQYGYRFYGYAAEKKGSFEGIPYLGRLTDINRHLRAHSVDEVVIALDLKDYGYIEGIVASCEKNGVKANVVPAFYQFLPSNPRMDEFDGMPVMVLRKTPLSNIFWWSLKRLFDIVVSIFCLLFFSPLLLACMVGVRCTMGKGVIYKQERIGYGFKPFTMYKLRTMQGKKTGKSRWTARNDTRRTPFGIFLRRFSIDELPQFWNVLKGDMSIVGPRPEIDRFVKKFQKTIPRYMVRHQVKPGITGWAQVHNLRGDTSIEERIRSDIYYIENWSFWLDIQIIVKTALKAFYNPYE